jgi:dihydrofolate synthase / folylpolyglutamate synthase
VTYSDAIRWLYDLRLFGAKLGLDNALKLAELAGNPHRRLRFIHVAGTNGKGSTCAMLESVYRARGLRVGLFTSPHLVSFAERIQVNRHLIPESEVVRWVSRVQSWLPQFPADHHPTFFEVVTVMALSHFAEQQCDLVVWETGLGGRLDATNIVTPLASVITNLGLEHQQWLGETIDQIAFEKAGIIKPGVPVITAAQPGQGLEVIAEAARQRGAALTTVGDSHIHRPPLNTLRLPLLGWYQRYNAATAIASVRALNEQIPVDEATLRAGLSQVDWPGRLQQVQTRAGQRIVLDGAHNPAGAEALRLALQTEFHSSQPALIFGVCCDKDWRSMCRILAPLADRVWLVPIPSERTLPPAEGAPVWHAANAGAAVTVCASLAEALQQTVAHPFVVIAGSLYLVGEAMELLHLAAAPPRDEKGLNEWTPKRPSPC